MRFSLSHSLDNNELLENSFQLKVNIIKYIKGGMVKQIVQFIDVSKDIRQDQYKVQTQLLEMINACVSHELRNPLNSIIA